MARVSPSVPRSNSDEVGCFAAQEAVMSAKEAGMAAFLSQEGAKMSVFLLLMAISM